MPNIPQKDAHLILTQSHKFPTKGDQCNASCTFYFCCQNSKDFEECRGFLMLNGQSERLLRRGLTDHDLEYIENAHSVIQRSLDNGHPEDASVILRDISRLREKVAPPTHRESGFSFMAKSARGVQDTPTREVEPETRINSGFQAMLSATSKGSTRHEPHTATRHMTGLFNEIDESQFPEFCNPMRCPPDFARHCRANRPENYGKPCIYLTPRNR